MLYRCYAKINLTLEVLGRREDGYHDLASLVHTISLADDLRLEPADQLLIHVLEVGICGTDRAIVRGDTGEAPPGSDYLVLGHEMLGQVVSAGAVAAGEYSPGDLVVCTVRRPCRLPECPTCAHGESESASRTIPANARMASAGFERRRLID